MAQRKKFTFITDKKDIQTENKPKENTNETTTDDKTSISSNKEFLLEKEKKTEVTEDTDTNNNTENLGEVVKRLEDKTPKAMDIKYVSPQKIKFHQDNKYPQDEIEKLANSILYNRLINPLEALYNIDEDMYTLESGERRFRALSYLIEKYKDCQDQNSYEYKLYYNHVKQFEVSGYPVNVVLPKGESEEEDTIDSSIRVRIANEEQRTYNAQRRALAISELEELYRRKNEILAQKGQKQININEQIAKDYNLTTRNVMYYKKTSNLIPELQEEFSKENLTLVESANIASLSEENQLQIYELIKAGSSKKEIGELTKQLNTARIEAENAQKQINKLQSDLEQKEKELQSEKTTVENKINKIKDELKKEMESSDPKNDIIEKLNNQLGKLEEKQSTLEKEKNELQQDAARKNSKIQALEEEIQKFQDQQKDVEEKPVIDNKSRDLIKEEIILKNNYNECLKNANTLLATFKRYEKLYDSQIAESMQLIDLEELKNNINKLAEKLKIR